MTTRPRGVRIFGKECCWDKRFNCGPTCQIVWRIWIFIEGVLLLVLTTTELILILVLLRRHWDNEHTFVADRMTKILMLTDGFFPLWLLITTLSAFMVAVWSIGLICRPKGVTPVGILFYRITTSIITLTILFGSIVQFVLYFLEWPDDTYRREVKLWMINDMGEENPPNSITKRWLNTQDFFECCGVNSAQDWTDAIHKRNGETGGNLSKNVDLPPSCCRANVGRCVESSAWNIGCLEPQIDTLKAYTNFNVVTTSLLYFIIDIVTNSVKKYFRKFPYQPTDDDDDPLVEGESPDERSPLNPITKPKAKKQRSNHDFRPKSKYEETETTRKSNRHANAPSENQEIQPRFDSKTLNPENTTTTSFQNTAFETTDSGDEYSSEFSVTDPGESDDDHADGGEVENIPLQNLSRVKVTNSLPIIQEESESYYTIPENLPRTFFSNRQLDENNNNDSEPILPEGTRSTSMHSLFGLPEAPQNNFSGDNVRNSESRASVRRKREIDTILMAGNSIEDLWKSSSIEPGPNDRYSWYPGIHVDSKKIKWPNRPQRKSLGDLDVKDMELPDFKVWTGLPSRSLND